MTNYKEAYEEALAELEQAKDELADARALILALQHELDSSVDIYSNDLDDYR